MGRSWFFVLVDATDYPCVFWASSTTLRGYDLWIVLFRVSVVSCCRNKRVRPINRQLGKTERQRGRRARYRSAIVSLFETRREGERWREEQIAKKVDDFSINSRKREKEREKEREREREREDKKDSLWTATFLSSITVNTDRAGSSGLAFARAHHRTPLLSWWWSSLEVSYRRHLLDHKGLFICLTFYRARPRDDKSNDVSA